MTEHELIRLTVGDESEGVRLDVFLARQFPQYSRVHLRKLINAADAKVDDKRRKAAYSLRGGQQVVLRLSPPTVADGPKGEDIPLDVLFESSVTVMTLVVSVCFVVRGIGIVFGVAILGLLRLVLATLRLI